jgi:hypothetical protein
MPRGLIAEAVVERLKTNPPVWVRPLAESNKSKRPRKLIGVSGPYAICEEIIANRMHQVRIHMDKLAYSDPPESSKPKPLPPPAAPTKKDADEPRESQKQMFPLLVATIDSAKPASSPNPPPPRVEDAKAKEVKAWCIIDEEAGRYYTATHKWSTDFADARHYQEEGGANKAMGRLTGRGGRSKGKALAVVHVSRAPVIMSSRDSRMLEKAKARTLEQLPPEPQKQALPPPTPVAELRAMAVPARANVPPQPAPPVAPTGAPTMSDDMATLQHALEGAMRAELLAYELLQHRKVEVARAKHEIDLLLLRRRNARN